MTMRLDASHGRSQIVCSGWKSWCLYASEKDEEDASETRREGRLDVIATTHRLHLFESLQGKPTGGSELILKLEPSKLI